MELILVRHTSVDVEKGTCYGQSNVNTTITFEEEKDIILKKLDVLNYPIISSPLSRCTKLAKEINSNFTIDNRIMELNFGIWEMQKWDEINDERLDTWMNNYIEYRCPKGESLLDMKLRVDDFIKDIKLKNRDLTIVTHGGVIRLFYHLINKVPLDKIFNLKIEYGDVHKFNIPN